MRIVLITQDDPFYLAENIKYLLDNLPSHSVVTGCVLLDVSPFGKKKSILKQAYETYMTFGFGFFLRYSTLYFINKLKKGKNIRNILKKYNVPIIKLEKSINHKQSLSLIKKHQPDLLISIAGNQIFKEDIINLAPKGCLNLHTSLLPKYRGLMPSFWVMKNNEEETGVSVFFVDKGIDSGPILIQKKIKIGNRTHAMLIKDTKKMGMDSIIEAIEKIHRDDLDVMPNPKGEMTYFSRPTKKDVKEFINNGKKFF